MNLINVDKAMSEYCSEKMLKAYKQHDDLNDILHVRFSKEINENFMISIASLIKYKIPPGENVMHLEHYVDNLYAYTNLNENINFDQGAIWGSMKLVKTIQEL